MKSWKAFVPVLVVFGGLSFAIYHVRSQSEAQAASVEATKVTRSAVAAVQLSDRYSGNVGIAK